MLERLKDLYYRIEQSLQLDKFTVVVFLTAGALTLCFALWVRHQEEAVPYVNINVSTPLSLENREYLVQCVFLCGESLYTLELEPEPQCICQLPNGMTCAPTLPLLLVEPLE